MTKARTQEPSSHEVAAVGAGVARAGKQSLVDGLRGPVRNKMDTVAAFFANYANPIGSATFTEVARGLFHDSAVTTVVMFGDDMSPGGTGVDAYLASFVGDNAFYGPRGVTHSADWGPSHQDGGANRVVSTLRGSEISRNGNPPRVIDPANLSWTETFTVDPDTGRITRLEVVLAER